MESLIDEFESARPQLMSLAHRLLGSHEDAEDVLQNAWIRAQQAAPSQLDNPAGWFTTVTTRLCLDRLRARNRRRELPLFDDRVGEPHRGADEEFLQREAVSRALLVLLDTLPPTQRVSYVLHDLFHHPYAEIAGLLGCSPAAAKKSASRARNRLLGHHRPPPVEDASTAEHRQIVGAFLAAARGGSMHTMIGLLAPEVVRTAEQVLLPAGGSPEVVGDRAVAEETRQFIDRIRVSVPMLVNGSPAVVIAPGGHPLAIVSFTVERSLITRIVISRLQPTDRLDPW